MALLEVKNLTMKFGSLVANSDVSFSVEQGTIVGLLGPNGAGKTTLFNCIAGLYRPSGGSVTFDGHDITNFPSFKVARCGIARTFQVVRPLNEMTVLDNVLVGSYLRHRNPKDALRMAEACIERCFLGAFRHRVAGDLTMGYKKRLEVARALATSPKLLMLDESVAGLTSTEVKEMVALICSLKASGITILMVEHIMEAIMPIADKIVVLNGGVKIAEDTPAVVSEDEQVITAYLGEKFSKRLKAMKEAKDRGAHAARS
ncbi:MAG TPA: ABC transporter ATP-binding protein [Holophaga sp.]|nr:ABC transporter ATP-binding protein [Holophaga sp.]